MKVTITKVENGYILTAYHSGEPPVRYVFEELEYGKYGRESMTYEEGADVENFAHLLQTLDSLIGPTTSRYSAKRVYVRIEAGDKFEEGKEE